MKISLAVVVVMVAAAGVTRGRAGGSSSSISIYQSTSSVPPLAESFSEGACIIPQTARKLDPKWVIFCLNLMEYFKCKFFKMNW